MAGRPEDSEVAAQLGRNLRAARRRARLTQQELARRCCLHPTYISHIERGSALPRVGTMVRLAGSLGVSADELLGGIEWAPPPPAPASPPGSYSVRGSA
jgi:transcriptional regulator with XRE-family HTH domain